MLLISTTHKPATDLGFLLHKNPQRTHEAQFTFGNAWLFYPEVTEERCTAALVLNIDAVGLTRSRSQNQAAIESYVNDRPYVAGSMLATAMTKMLGTAIGGRSKERPELAQSIIPLEARLPVVSATSEGFVRGLFEPLGWEVEVKTLPLDPQFPEWGESTYFDVTLRGEGRLCDLLNQIYLLVPVMDSRKHYYFDRDEVEKLLRKAEGWLKDHPLQSAIIQRYLRRRQSLIQMALDQLNDGIEETPEETPTEPVEEKPKRLHLVRHDAVREEIQAAGAKSVLDLGCGNGRLVRWLVKQASIDKVVGVEVSWRLVERLLDFAERLPSHSKRKLEIIHGSLLYHDARLEGFDFAAVVEVIEHLDPARLTAFERVLFERAKPKRVCVTTPNREYNAVYEAEGMTGMRHDDHRFEWTREEFKQWVDQVCERNGYRAEIKGIGEEHPEFGASSQMAVFIR